MKKMKMKSAFSLRVGYTLFPTLGTRLKHLSSET